ncbi:hypothetical protein [Corynebacterium aquilae]|uniref:GIY-YIG domain-containing protein n=1 Tax=Corynebacterium aquilae DSM 44791 TaxID=1431546 RepID=A0A1L7CF61_9CORY|nr:hypothetical protein [Corynebacterium aquilae]APT84413.1 hypothetical protein CAQU_04265 [Corynebacterium aquilae DSM 44791]
MAPTLDPTVIELQLLEQRADGSIRAAIPYTVIPTIYVVPRESFDDYADHSELNHPGIYVMVERIPGHKGNAYIGQANNRANGKGAIGRVREHIKQGRHTWATHALFILGEKAQFNATELDVLENTFTRLAQKSGRFQVANSYTPSASEGTERHRQMLSKCVSDARLILTTLGWYVFEPTEDKAKVQGSKTSDSQADNAVDPGTVASKSPTFKPAPEHPTVESLKAEREPDEHPATSNQATAAEQNTKTKQPLTQHEAVFSEEIDMDATHDAVVFYMRVKGHSTPARGLWQGPKEFVLLAGSPLTATCCRGACRSNAIRTIW